MQICTVKHTDKSKFENRVIMKKITEKILSQKGKTIPILSFPSVQLLGVTVGELVTSAELQAEGMAAVVSRGNLGAAVTPMDLSVEAECFGAPVRKTDDEVPTVEYPILEDIMDADKLTVPQVGAGRSELYIEGTRKARELLPDLPIFCGAIGPYSLAGRLFDMTELMMECYDDPDEVKILLTKATDFIIEYIKAHKAAGADGVILAEPAAGLLSPSLCEEFSSEFVKRIVEEVADDDFVFCYHNCGGSVAACAESIAEIGADIYHFGNAVPLTEVIGKIPKDSVVMGNIDPLIFRDGTTEDVRAAVDKVFAECSGYENFMISSGCDIPADAKWENLDAYFARVGEIYD